MLEKVKSSYFVAFLFLYVNEKEKLKLIKYNKRLQKIINISINNYIHFQGTNIIYDSDGKVKEYFHDGQLIYEGEYLHNERNGKGKEYYQVGYLKYEGDFLKGKKNGKGKEYYPMNMPLYEGEYLNGKKNGKGRLYSFNFNKKLLFEGTFLNDKIIIGTRYNSGGNKLYEINNFNGKGKEYYNDGKLAFEGEYLNGKKHGKGKEYFKNGKLIFEGEYLNDKRWNGKVYDNLNNSTYEINDGNGIFILYNEQGNVIFEGATLHGEKNGKGKEYNFFNGKLIFEGDYLYGKRNGKGKNIMMVN